MKIGIPQSTLQKYLELLTKVTTKHVSLPVLQSVLLEVKDSKLTIKATNLEIAVEVTIDEVKVDREGKMAVPASTFLQTIQLNKERNIYLEQKEDEGVVSVSFGKTNTSIKLMSHEEFPNISKVEANPISINKELFVQGIKNVAFAASQSSIKPELNSVYIYQKKEHSFTFVATDSFRLAEKTVPQKGVILDSHLLLPQKNAIEISRMCDLLDSEVDLLVTENQCALHFKEGVFITSRMTTGSFPDYEAILPKEFVTNTTVLKQDLLTSLKKTNIFLNKFRQVSLAVSNSQIEISANNGEVGMVSDIIPAQGEGEELLLSFNQQYISDPLSYFIEDSIILQFAGIGRPLVMSSVSDKSFRYLVMPMNK